MVVAYVRLYPSLAPNASPTSRIYALLLPSAADSTEWSELSVRKSPLGGFGVYPRRAGKAAAQAWSNAGSVPVLLPYLGVETVVKDDHSRKTLISVLKGHFERVTLGELQARHGGGRAYVVDGLFAVPQSSPSQKPLPPATRLEVLIGARINSDLLGGTAEQYWHARGSAGEIKAEIVQAEQAEADAHAKPAKKKLTRVMPSEAVLQSFNQAGGGGAAAAGSSSGAAADDMELQRPPSATSVRSDPGPLRPGAFGGPGRAKTMPRVAWDDAQVTSAVVHAQTASQFGVVPPPNRLESLIGARIRSKLLRGTAEAAQAGRQAAIAERPDEE